MSLFYEVIVCHHFKKFLGFRILFNLIFKILCAICFLIHIIIIFVFLAEQQYEQLEKQLIAAHNRLETEATSFHDVKKKNEDLGKYDWAHQFSGGNNIKRMFRAIL